jgi:hypothetical protein
MRRTFLVITTVFPALAFFPALASAQSAPPAAPATAPDSTAPAPAPSTRQQQFVQRFEAANTTHDGRLTLAQAQAAGMRGIVKHFQEIDTSNAGYVTLPEIKSWYQARHAQKAAPAPS